MWKVFISQILGSSTNHYWLESWWRAVLSRNLFAVSCLGFSDCRDGNWCKKSWELLGCRLCVVFSRRWSKSCSLFLSLVKVEKCIRNKFPSGKTCNIVIAAWKQGKKIQSWSIKVVENLLNWECTCGIWYQIPCTKRDWNWILATNDSIDYKVDQPN